MQKMTTALREQGGLKQKPGGVKYRRKYTRKYDLEILKKIAAQNSDPIISGLARRVARSLEKERQSARGSHRDE